MTCNSGWHQTTLASHVPLLVGSDCISIVHNSTKHIRSIWYEAVHIMPNKVCNRDILPFKKMAFFFCKDGIFLFELGEWVPPTTLTPSSQSGGLKCTLRINRESSSKRAVLLRDVNLYKRFRGGQISAKYSIFLHLKESSEFVAHPMKDSCDLMAWEKKDSCSKIEFTFFMFTLLVFIDYAPPHLVGSLCGGVWGSRPLPGLNCMGASQTLELPPCSLCSRDVLLADGQGINRDAALNPRWLENAGLKSDPCLMAVPAVPKLKKS